MLIYQLEIYVYILKHIVIIWRILPIALFILYIPPNLLFSF